MALALQSYPPPFVLTSAFPRAGLVHFFPVPMSPPTPATKNWPRPKDLKRAKYVSEAGLRSMLAGAQLTEVYKSSEQLHGGQVLVAAADWPGVPRQVKDARSMWGIEKRPRVTIDRVSQNSSIYFTGRVAFNAECGLWFGVRWLQDDAALVKKLADLFVDLGDAGLGGDRTSGFGACEITSASQIELPDGANRVWTTLSRYLPRKDETAALSHARSAYAIETICSWVDSPVSKSERRIPVQLVAEGSVLGPLSRAVPGQLIDAQPDYNGAKPLGHPVYRSGLALAVGLGTGG